MREEEERGEYPAFPPVKHPKSPSPFPIPIAFENSQILLNQLATLYHKLTWKLDFWIPVTMTVYNKVFNW